MFFTKEIFGLYIAICVLIFFLLAYLAARYAALLRAKEKGDALIEKIAERLKEAKPVLSFNEFQNFFSPVVGEIRAFLGKGEVGIAYVESFNKKLYHCAFAESQEKPAVVLETVLNDGRNERWSGEIRVTKGEVWFPLLKEEDKGGILCVYHAGKLTSTQTKSLALAASIIAPALAFISLFMLKQHRGPDDKEDVLADLEIARILQSKMLPPELPSVPGVEIASRIIPAKEVTGDFYDCFPLREKTLAINIGDVSGKSIPAALLVSMARYIFRFPPSPYIRPSKLMETANKIVYANGGGMFISDCFATLDLASKQVTYVNAGHPPLIHYREKDNHASFLPSTGPLLGIAEDSRYRDETSPLASGDLLFFYSDGLTEIKTALGKVLGEEGLVSLFQRYKELPPAKLVDELMSEILRLYEETEQKRDDISCLVLKIL